ncbi:hypothetical protein Ddye_016422 [Dipteronia dyeriana]|uniref:Reverse transcriptase domain-containing protein n=1 Tax=Dipteronia dyeriana TaxID=168575 RepID=A0AAD9X023_9ROSI|nr:hypothetical protein Ddye_016422 [Dipteronia dyeriana]
MVSPPMHGLAEDPMSFEASSFSTPHSSSTTTPTCFKGTVSSDSKMCSLSNVLTTISSLGDQPVTVGGSFLGSFLSFSLSLKFTNAQARVRFYDLSWEYWHLKIIFDLARGIEVPLRLDKATIDSGFRHYARVLVDVDMSHLLPSSVLLERDEFRSSFISVETPQSSSVVVSLGPPVMDTISLGVPNSKAELRFIPGSSWAKQMESEDLDSDGLNQRTKMIKHRNNSLKRVLKDLCCSHRPSLVCISEPIVAFDSISTKFWYSLDLRLVGDSCEDFKSMIEDCNLIGFFHSGVVALGLNSNFIILLPKMRDSIMVDQFRPIVLGNFLFKISSKILANRKCYGGNMALKIDIRKAFDTLDWKFLCQVLRGFGFSQTINDYIVSILGS